MNNDYLVFNGVNAATGTYLLPPLPASVIASRVKGLPVDKDLLRELQHRRRRETEVTLAPMEGIDPNQLEEAGWGVIFAYGVDPAIPDALRELLNHRQQLATRRSSRRYQEFLNAQAYRPGESTRQFLARNGAGGAGAVNPDKMPYYLLIVGDPETIPYQFQYQLDVQHSVGRIHFETVEEYANYAQSVVEAERNQLTLPRTAAFWGASNPDDRATALSATHLVAPLSASLKEKFPDWSMPTFLTGQATKPRLGELLGGPATPALLFTASHGVAFPHGDPRQLPTQGALLCQEWPGPEEWRKALPEDFYFAGSDIPESARLLGLIGFHFACYGGGTPRYDDFAHGEGQSREAIAPHAFVARLPQRLLAHPKGGALAIVAHVERAWGYSFLWQHSAQINARLNDFESVLARLLKGHPVGSAMEFFNSRYAELSTILSTELEDIKFGKLVDDLELAGLWTANNDARSYVILGDPAVRLSVGNAGAATAERPTIATSSTSIKLSAPTAVAYEAASEPSPTSESPLLETKESASIQQPMGISPTEVHALAGADAAPTPMMLGSSGELPARLNTAIEELLNRVTAILEKFTADTNAIRVASYVSDNLSDVGYVNGRITGATLQSLTYVALNGDTEVCIPHETGELNEQRQKVHADTVDRALRYRAELLQSAANMATALLQVSKKE